MSKKYSISGAKIWQWMKEKRQLLAASFSRKAFCEHKRGHYEEMLGK
jgi:hypothetical protein